MCKSSVSFHLFQFSNKYWLTIVLTESGCWYPLCCRSGGACTAAAFLREFVTAPHWAHLDIAGVMSNKDEIPYLQKGMSGRPTRTLVEFAAGLAHNGWAPEHISEFELHSWIQRLPLSVVETKICWNVLKHWHFQDWKSYITANLRYMYLHKYNLSI